MNSSRITDAHDSPVVRHNPAVGAENPQHHNAAGEGLQALRAAVRSAIAAAALTGARALYEALSKLFNQITMREGGPIARRL